MKKQIKEIVTHPLFTGSAVMVIGSNLVSSINYLYHLVMGRMLGPGGYGELASLISLIGLLGIIPASINLVIIKYVSGAKNEAEISSLVGWLKDIVFKVSLFFCFFFLILSPLVLSFLKINKISYLLFIGLFFFFGFQSMLNRAILQGLLKFKEMIVTLLLENMTKLLISIFLIFIGFSVNGAMISFVLASILGLYATNFYISIKKRNNPKISPNIKPMMIFIVPVLIQSISTTSIYSSDVILVKHFFSSHDAGIYASLSTLGKIIFFGTGPISAVMFPLVSRRKSRGESYKKVFTYSFIATAFFAICVSLFYFLAPEFAIKLLFGSAYLESSKMLIWFGIFMGLFTLSSLLINFGLSLGKNRIVILPLIFSTSQIVLISLFHKTLLMVVMISIIINALLLISLLIYLSLERALVNGKKAINEDKLNFNNSAGL